MAYSAQDTISPQWPIIRLSSKQSPKPSSIKYLSSFSHALSVYSTMWYKVEKGRRKSICTLLLTQYVLDVHSLPYVYEVKKGTRRTASRGQRINEFSKIMLESKSSLKSMCKPGEIPLSGALTLHRTAPWGAFPPSLTVAQQCLGQRYSAALVLVCTQTKRVEQVPLILSFKKTLKNQLKQVSPRTLIIWKSLIAK